MFGEVLGNERAEYGAQIVSALVTQLSWTHFLMVMPLKEDLQREFYLTMSIAEKWSTRTLQSKIDGMLFERSAIASNQEVFGTCKRIKPQRIKRGINNRYSQHQAF